MRAVQGDVPAVAQQGLPAAFVASGLFLACQCHPQSDIEVALADDVTRQFPTEVAAVEALSGDVCALRLKAPASYNYRAGQFLQLTCGPYARNYSLASVPVLDADLILHVRRIPGGQMGQFIFERLRPGDRAMLSEPRGHCFYVPGASDLNLLLVGTGCGLAPLYAIARDALQQGHRGQIKLYHGSRTTDGLYLDGPLRRLAQEHVNFDYIPCVSQSVPLPGQRSGRALDCALLDLPDITGWRVYLCGNPDMVQAARMQFFLAGASSAEIYADPFLPTGVSAGAPDPAPLDGQMPSTGLIPMGAG